MGQAELELLVACLSNRAAVRIKTQDYYKALSDSKEVLKLEPSHLKARFRAALALTALSHHVEAISGLEELTGKVERRQRRCSHANSNPNPTWKVSEAKEALPRVLKRLEESFVG